MKELEEVINKYNLILDQMPEKNKFYNLKSVYNFIIFFEEIKDEESKNKTLFLLNEYIDFITKNSVDSNAECRYLFNKYLFPIGEIYTKHCKFTYFIRPTSILTIILILNILLFIFSVHIYYYILLNTIGLFFWVKMNLKIKTHRFYCINW